MLVAPLFVRLAVATLCLVVGGSWGVTVSPRAQVESNGGSTNHDVQNGRFDVQLTARQAELLRHCIQRGYYSIPRRMTLRELGAEIGISATSLSLALRRAEGKIILAFAQGAAVPQADGKGVDGATGLQALVQTAMPPGIVAARSSKKQP